MKKYFSKGFLSLEFLFLFWFFFGLTVACLVRFGFFAQFFRELSKWVNVNVYAIKLSASEYHFGADAAFQIAHSISAAVPLMVLSFLFASCSCVEGKLNKKPADEVAFWVLFLSLICGFGIYFGCSSRGPNSVFLKNEYAFSFLISVYAILLSYIVRLFICLINRR
jgi:hypothetical protein